MQFNMSLPNLLFGPYFGFQIENLCFIYILAMVFCAEMSWFKKLARGSFFTFLLFAGRRGGVGSKDPIFSIFQILESEGFDFGLVFFAMSIGHAFQTCLPSCLYFILKYILK